MNGLEIGRYQEITRQEGFGTTGDYPVQLSADSCRQTLTALTGLHGL
jgi:hypothetical protein